MTVALPDVVRSALLDGVPGLAHGFTTRALGSMAGSLYPSGEQARNRAALARAIGMRIVKTSQVHESDVALVEADRVTRLRDGAVATPSDRTPLEADALVTRDIGLALAVAVADCVPVLVATREGWLGLAHAGWEGTARRVVAALCAALTARGADLRRARAALGPSIGPCCYAIDAERAEVVRAAIGGADLCAEGERFVLDLWSANRRQLTDAGVGEVDVAGVCTRDAVERFFSHRGERGRAGRGLAFIGWRR